MPVEDRRRTGRFPRLNPFEHMYLRGERPEWPGHFGGLAIVEGASLLDTAGELDLPEIRRRLDLRLQRIPRLRQRVLEPGFGSGRPLWVDDADFSIEHHVHRADVPPPGGEVELLETAARVYGSLLDRNRPLWEMWFLTGLEGERIGVLLKLHHAVADGLAAVAVMGSLFDFEPDMPDPENVPWVPCEVPGRWPLLADAASGRIRAAGRILAALGSPGRLLGFLRLFVKVARRTAGVQGAERTSLNRRVAAGRHVRFARLDLGEVRMVAHGRGGKVNDVVLTVWAGGLRDLLASRGELTEDVEPTAGLTVSTRAATDATIGNQVGTVVVPLPVWNDDPWQRLDLVIDRTRAVKERQHPAAIMGALVAIAATPPGWYMMMHQRAANVVVSNVVGPSSPAYVLGARIVDVLPIIDLAGNLGLVLCAFSYAGRLYLVVTADERAFPDLETLIRGIERDWDILRSDGAPAASSGPDRLSNSRIRAGT